MEANEYVWLCIDLTASNTHSTTHFLDMYCFQASIKTSSDTFCAYEITPLYAFTRIGTQPQCYDPYLSIDMLGRGQDYKLE